jgi:hypothetical protein
MLELWPRARLSPSNHQTTMGCTSSGTGGSIVNHIDWGYVAKKIKENLGSYGINLMSSLGCKENSSLRSPQIRNNVLMPMVYCWWMLNALKEDRVINEFYFWMDWKWAMDKWATLYDTNGLRCDIMATNFVEVYNWVMWSKRTSTSGNSEIHCVLN